MPLVSVIIPNYNHAHCLEARIESVLAQSFSDFEMILLDDASADNSVAIIEKYRSHPKTTQVLLNSINTGSPFAQWQKGLASARGKWIWIAESDDIADPSFLETALGKLDQQPDASFFIPMPYISLQKTTMHLFSIMLCPKTGISKPAGGRQIMPSPV
ncbi:MAG: glycosyltransferase family 2 protein [Chitinophagaceae bacterium]|nr:glycosyltransferase family 2 protein [Chitinophagaceae bacterium]